MRLFPVFPKFSEVGARRLRKFIRDAEAVATSVAANPAEYIAQGFSKEDLREQMQEGVGQLAEARAELARREAAGEAEEIGDELNELAAQARGEAAAETTEDPPEGGDGEDDDEPGGETAEGDVEELAADDDEALEPAAETAEAETVVAAAPAARGRRPLPKPNRREQVAESTRGYETAVSLLAAADGLGPAKGDVLTDGLEVAKMMVEQRRRFGTIAEGTRDDVPVARMEWAYPDERQLEEGLTSTNFEKIALAVDEHSIRSEMERRRKLGATPEALVASGGLCAPVTPYYNLQMISVADRPVRGALPAFMADRGGIRYAAPPALSAITTGVGIKTAAEDAAGGSEATKTCQVVSCPPFSETDVAIIYHCLQFGNLGARTFPERVAHFNNLVLAAHARLAEGHLLDGIKSASTAVTAASITGAVGDLLSQAVTAADGIRSRNRMRTDAVLRALYPFWVLDLLVSDVYRSQFERFDSTPEDFVALLREANIEPTFYMDSSTTGGQLFATQSAAALVAFPATVEWFLFPEGSFLYLDGGVLELGLVRDSVLNKTNDFQIFGETFENVAFIGVEALAITSTTCDSGAVSAPVAITECGDYGAS